MSRLFAALLATALLCSPASAQDGAEWRARGAFYSLYAANLDVLREWYVDKLGFEVVAIFPGLPTARVSRAALLTRGDYVLEVGELRDPGETPTGERRIISSPGWGRIGFVVDDVASVEQHLLERGVAFNHPTVPSGVPGMKTFAVRDPEGNTIQFFGH